MTKSNNHRCPRYRVQLVREGSVLYCTKRRLESTTAAIETILDLTYEILRASPVEQLWAVSVDIRYVPIGLHEISIGTLDSALVAPRSVFQPLLLVNAAAFFLVHNHPSGDPTLSDIDYRTTTAMRKCGDDMGIHLLDHVVVAHTPEGDWVANCAAEPGLRIVSPRRSEASDMKPLCVAET